MSEKQWHTGMSRSQVAKVCRRFGIKPAPDSTKSELIAMCDLRRAYPQLTRSDLEQMCQKDRRKTMAQVKAMSDDGLTQCIVDNDKIDWKTELKTFKQSFNIMQREDVRAMFDPVQQETEDEVRDKVEQEIQDYEKNIDEANRDLDDYIENNLTRDPRMLPIVSELAKATLVSIKAELERRARLVQEMGMALIPDSIAATTSEQGDTEDKNPTADQPNLIRKAFTWLLKSAYSTVKFTAKTLFKFASKIFSLMKWVLQTGYTLITAILRNPYFFKGVLIFLSDLFRQFCAEFGAWVGYIHEDDKRALDGYYRTTKPTITDNLVATFLKERLPGMIQSVWRVTKDFWSTIANAITGTLEWSKNAIVSFSMMVWEYVSGVSSKLGGWMSLGVNIGSDILGAVAQWLSKTKGVVTGSVESLKAGLKQLGEKDKVAYMIERKKEVPGNKTPVGPSGVTGMIFDSASEGVDKLSYMFVYTRDLRECFVRLSELLDLRQCSPWYRRSAYFQKSDDEQLDWEEAVNEAFNNQDPELVASIPLHERNYVAQKQDLRLKLNLPFKVKLTEAEIAEAADAAVASYLQTRKAIKAGAPVTTRPTAPKVQQPVDSSVEQSLAGKLVQGVRSLF